MKKLILACILSFSFQFLIAQDVTNLDSVQYPTPLVIKDSRIDKLNETYHSTYKLIGYRIQIYSGDKKQEGNQIRSKFSRIYKKKMTYLDYEQPYWKVRAGDFRTKLEALKFKNEIINHFENCFIIKVKIEIENIDN